jgi:hypothetical protein
MPSNHSKRNAMTPTAEMIHPVTEQDQQVVAPAVPVPQEEQAARAAVVGAVQRDCLHQPDLYLDEVRVPFGGE